MDSAIDPHKLENPLSSLGLPNALGRVVPRNDRVDTLRTNEEAEGDERGKC